MRNCRIPTIICVALLCIPLSVSAQGLFGSSIGLPSLSGSTSLSDSTSGRFAVSAGWVNHDKGFESSWIFTLSPAGDTFLFFQPLRGLWIGGEYGGRFSDTLGYILGGGVLAPNEGGAVLRQFINGALNVEFDLIPDTQWSVLDVAVTYRIFDNCDAIAGFRWDHYTTRWILPEDPLGTVINWKINWYAPFVGIQSEYGAQSSLLTFRLIGMPYTPGNALVGLIQPHLPASVASKQSFDSGYFVEATLDYTCSPLEHMYFGGFARYSAVRSITQGPSNTAGAPSPSGFFDELSLSFTKQTWTFGASLSLPFDLGGWL